MSKEAIRLALGTLEAIANHGDIAAIATPDGVIFLETAITALREALAEQPAIKQDLTPEQTAPGSAHYEDGDVFERIAARKQQPAQQQEPVAIGEPVGWHSKQYGFVYMALQPHQFEVGSTLCLKNGTPAWRIESSCSMTALISMSSLPHGTVFYTSPPAQRKPLTDEEIERIYTRYGGGMINCARAIERAHGIKEDA